jgi:hypothetical protein
VSLNRGEKDMSVTPLGKSVQTMYRDYREGKLLVNRKYQRKLVWSIEEKQRLIDSILRGFPIPLILLAERSDLYGPGKYEIIDGMQRFNAIFTFIENAFDLNGEYFDVSEFARAKQLAEEGVFLTKKESPFLSPKRCANILDYQLAITVYPTREEGSITEVFGRINASGRQLSPQEQRQAGVTSQFSSLVRNLAAELRGDVSKEVLLLTEMPEISIETGKEIHGYGVTAENTIWCKQGILSVKQLKESEDEQIVADLAASILLDSPIGASKELLDKLYDETTAEGRDLERKLVAYGADRLSTEIKSTFSVIKQVIEECSDQTNYLRDTVRPGRPYPIKIPFYAIFMAFFYLIVKKQMSPENYKGIIGALAKLSDKMRAGAHYETTDNRTHNINVTKGLVQDFFVDREPPVFGHGPALVMDFENSLRRSRIETPRYEFKQGILRLDGSRKIDDDLLNRFVEITCGISNLGPDSEGYLYLGVADTEADAKRIESLDSITPKEIANHYVVGVDREAKLLRITLDQYVQKIVSVLQNSDLSDPLKTQVLSNFDTITIHGLTVIRVVVPAQRDLSFIGEQAFYRKGSSTVELKGQELVAVSKLFPA